MEWLASAAIPRLRLGTPTFRARSVTVLKDAIIAYPSAPAPQDTETESAMNFQEEKIGSRCRQEGRDTWFSSQRGNGNPYPTGSYESYCFEAGYRQDVRCTEELNRDWLKYRQRQIV